MTLQTHHYDIVRKPIITEKATYASQFGALVFEVQCQSNKSQIKQAIESLFDVKVKSVNTILVKGKTKRFRGYVGKRRKYKKAYVTLADGYTIDLATAGV